MIALSSELSRRRAEEAIEAGRVEVNGKVVAVQGTLVDPSSDCVSLDGRPIAISPEHTYIVFNKPRGFMVTKSDPEGRPTIWENLKEWKEKLNSVGRLDFASEGLLILTDDGDFINRMTHPRHEIWKTYRALVRGAPGAFALKELAQGVKLSDGKTLPARVRRIDRGGANAVVEISIREGRNRQVRRMFEATGFPVIELRRTAIGKMKLGSLGVGQWRLMKPDEVDSLLNDSAKAESSRVKGQAAAGHRSKP